ncbi:MAG TPA: hypothetical protein PKX91_03380 [Clostridia bacterium]|jgi:hypothetical protein|nr:hypothetical protein [Clostridia bacterium]
MVKNRQRKKIGKVGIAIIIISVIILTSGLGFTLWYYTEMIRHKPTESVLGERFGSFGYAPITMGENAYFENFSSRFDTYSTEINAGMSIDSSPDQKKLAAYILYRIGCLANDTALFNARHVLGSGVATGIIGNEFMEDVEVSGKINISSSYYNLMWPQNKNATFEEKIKSSKYLVSEEYTQIPADGVSASSDAIVDLGEPLLRKTLPFARRAITTPEYCVICHGEPSSAVITASGTTANFESRTKYEVTKTEEAQEESKFVRHYSDDFFDEYGLNAKDASLFLINLETIKGETVEITKHTGKDLNEKDVPYYTVWFDIDCDTNKGTENSATYFAEQFYTAMTPDIFKSFLSNYSLLYSGLKIGFSIFQTGYFRTFETEEQWEMKGLASFIIKVNASVLSNNKTTEYFSYDYDTVWQGFSNRYFGDNEHVNLPRKELPFYETLKGFEPQEYGTYR